LALKGHSTISECLYDFKTVLLLRATLPCYYSSYQ